MTRAEQADFARPGLPARPAGAAVRAGAAGAAPTAAAALAVAAVESDGQGHRRRRLSRPPRRASGGLGGGRLRLRCPSAGPVPDAAVTVPRPRSRWAPARWAKTQ